MSMVTRIQTIAISLTPKEERRIHHHLEQMERRLTRYPEPITTLMITAREADHRVTAELRVQLGHLGGHLLSHEEGDTADSAVRRAVEDIQRQIERLHATHSGEATYGVPSRREPPTAN